MKHIISPIKLLAFVIIISFLPSAISSAQTFREIYVGLGLSESWIIGSQDAKKPFVPLKPEQGDFRGGSFDNSQSGIDARATFVIDQKKRWRVPVGIDYSFYVGKERVPEGYTTKTYFSDNLNIFQIYTGAHYVFYRMNFAKARAWAGPEIRASFVHNQHYSYEIDYQNPEFEDRMITGSKKNAFRVGPSFRLGVDGELGKGYYVNISSHYTYMNLIGADDERGELLSPGYRQKRVENPAQIFGLTFMLQYKL
ncbi:MAG: hypothetical protein ACM3U1_11700 [Chloroflexota bacterium]